MGKFKFNLGDQAKVTGRDTVGGEPLGTKGVIVERQRPRQGMPAIYALFTGGPTMRTYFESDLSMCSR